MKNQVVFSTKKNQSTTELEAQVIQQSKSQHFSITENERALFRYSMTKKRRPDENKT